MAYEPIGEVEPMTFEEAVNGDPRESGICEYCDLELTGCNSLELCEQRACRDAYEMYLEDHFEKPCTMCQYHSTSEHMQKTPCDTCDRYDKWKAKGGDYSDFHGLTCPQ